MYGHYVARARPGLLPLADERRARWLWGFLRTIFPGVLAVVLMPDHLHLIAAVMARARRRLAGLLGAFARHFELGELWLPVPEPEPFASTDKLQRGVRYVLLNPSRPWRHGGSGVQLAADPLQWPWSTLRDAVGAVVEPRVTAEHVGRVLGWQGHDPRERLHRYVTADPHVAIAGTPPPVPLPPSLVPSATMDDIAAAALAATRSAADALQQKTDARRLLVALAHRQGWRHPQALATMLGVHRNSVSRIVRDCPPEWLAAGALCLGDDRLRAACPEIDLRLGVSPQRRNLWRPEVCEA